MPIEKDELIREIKKICKRLDSPRRKLWAKQNNDGPPAPKPPTLYRLLKNNSNYEKLLHYIQVEVNEGYFNTQRYGAIPKHQRVRMLNTILGKIEYTSWDGLRWPLVEALADYLSLSQIKEIERNPSPK